MLEYIMTQPLWSTSHILAVPSSDPEINLLQLMVTMSVITFLCPSYSLRQAPVFTFHLLREKFRRRSSAQKNKNKLKRSVNSYLYGHVLGSRKE
mmetsp:Transcript_17919/g.35750  ORF Transcript_17919/g.35750 Transcript_17919/m.35750 type:complete len:94 (-) Transcript_17919:1390-1671(-)